MTGEIERIAADGCPYYPAYSGRCNAPQGESGFCSRHAGKSCGVCGEQATHECNHTGQFVCGAPLCGNCEGYTDDSKASGTWGFMNHGHRPRAHLEQHHAKD